MAKRATKKKTEEKLAHKQISISNFESISLIEELLMQNKKNI